MPRHVLNTTPLEERTTFTVKDVALYLACSYSKARDIVRSGDVRSYQLGTQRYVRRADLEAYVAALLDGPDAA